MAEILDINQMLANEYEPKRGFRWILEIEGIDAFTAKTAARPSKEHEETTIDWINEKRFLAGKGRWNPIDIELYDPISPSQSQKVMEWLKLVHDDSTGKMGYASTYKKDFFLKILDGGGLVVEKWQSIGSWPKNITLGNLDYTDNNALTVKFSCVSDKWKLIF
jgi:hypothetical protein